MASVRRTVASRSVKNPSRIRRFTPFTSPPSLARDGTRVNNGRRPVELRTLRKPDRRRSRGCSFPGIPFVRSCLGSLTLLLHFLLVPPDQAVYFIFEALLVAAE